MHRLAVARRLLQATRVRTAATEGLQCALDWLLSGQGTAGGTSRGWRGWVPARCFHSTGSFLTAEPALAVYAVGPPEGEGPGPGVVVATATAATAAEPLPGCNGQPLEGSTAASSAAADFNALVKSGDVDGCLKQLGRMSGRRALNSYNYALRHLPPCAVLHVFEHMRARGMAPVSYTVVYLAKAYKAEGLLQQLDGAMLGLLERHQEVAHWSIFFEWADAHAEAGSPDGVRLVMNAVQQHGQELTAHYWSLLIKASHKARKCSRPVIDGVFEEMDALGVRPTEEVYRAAIYTFGNLGHAERSGEVFQRMVEAGIKPGMASYSALINAYADSSMPDQAVQTFRAMHCAGVKANHQTYAALMKAFARVGDVDRAQAVLTTMRWGGVEPNAYIYGCLIDTCVAARKPREARKALDAMVAARLRPSEVHYTALLSAYASVGDVLRAKAVLVEMKAAGVPPNLRAYTALMRLLGSQDQPEEAQAVFDEAVKLGLKPDRITYCVLLDSLLSQWARSKGGHKQLLQRAQEVFDSAAQLQPQLNLSHPDTIKVDLHGYSAWAAQLAVLSVLQRLLGQYKADKRFVVSHLQIVTGRGNRSVVRNKSPVREALLALLQPLVPVRLGSRNEGVLLVLREHLQRLMGLFARQKRSFSLRDMQRYLVEP